MARTLLASALLLVAGCTASRDDAKTVFAQAVEQHQQRHFVEAAAGYQRVLRQFANQPYWCAQALRSLANVRVVQGQIDQAVKLYRQVGERFPAYDWEVLQAWKSAADLLWETGRQNEARKFYQQIVARFDDPEASTVVQTIVRVARTQS